MKYIFFMMLIGLTQISFSQNMLIDYGGFGSEGPSKMQMAFNDSIAVIVSPEVDNSHEAPLFFFIKQKQGLSYFTEQLFNVKFYVKDSSYNMVWQLTDDTLTVLNEKCNAAKTSFRGRNYIAFYAPAIACNNGPWKFGGLPGLILMVKSEDGYVGWKASRIIKNYTGKITWPNTGKHKFLSWSEYVDKYKKTVAYLIKSARSNGTLTDDSEGWLKIENDELFYPELQTGKGIKF